MNLRTSFNRAAVATTLFLAPVSVYAQKGLQDAANNVANVGKALGTGTQDSLPKLVGGIINAVLGVMGIVFVLLIVYAGILYMQAGVDPEKAKKAKALIVNAVIGLVLVVAAYAISKFIIDQVIGATA